MSFIANVLDYSTLCVIWWGLICLIFTGFAIADGFDLGVAMLAPLVTRTDSDRRVLLNTIGPVWEGNQVWLILGLGAVFAAFPQVYSVILSYFYCEMFFIVIALMLRPVSLDYRSKLVSKAWRGAWDTLVFISGLVPPLLMGSIAAKIAIGIPFKLDDTKRLLYQTAASVSFPQMAFILICVSSCVVFCLIQGGLYLLIKTEGEIHLRSKNVVMTTIPLLFLLWIGGIFAHVSNGGFPNQLILSLDIISLGSLLLSFIATLADRNTLAFFCSSTACGFSISAFVCKMFPFIVTSSVDRAHSLTVWNSASSHNTLAIMLIATVILLPIVLLYVSWVYRVLRGKITADFVTRSGKHLY